MAKRHRSEGVSDGLQRAGWLIQQLMSRGHPNWKDENGEVMTRCTQVEIARRTGLTTGHINAILYPERGGNKDIGYRRLRQLARGVGIDIRFFFDDYEEMRDFMTYLPAALERRIADNAIKNEVSSLRSELRTEMVAMYGGLRNEIAELTAAHNEELDRMRKKLVKAETSAQVANARLVGLEEQKRDLEMQLANVKRGRR